MHASGLLVKPKMPGTQASLVIKGALGRHETLCCDVAQIKKILKPRVSCGLLYFLHTCRMPLDPLFKVGTVFFHSVKICEGLLSCVLSARSHQVIGPTIMQQVDQILSFHHTLIDSIQWLLPSPHDDFPSISPRISLQEQAVLSSRSAAQAHNRMVSQGQLWPALAPHPHRWPRPGLNCQCVKWHRCNA